MKPRITRFAFIGAAGAVAALGAFRRAFAAPLLEVVNQRPYDWQTPLDELGAPLYTPNRVFFIRSHMGPPATIDMKSWRLIVDGLVKTPLRLTPDDLRRLEKVELPAVLQCAGNGRFFYGVAYPAASHPAGAQWTYGGVGFAKWGGVRVRDVLGRAGVTSGARFATNSGLDNPLLPSTPKFVRGLELDKLMDPDSIFAYEMNGEPLSYYHGYPVRLIVPGWAGDHWVKWFTKMTLAGEITSNFWTAVGYRWPNKLGLPGVGVPPDKEHPVTALDVKSIITAPRSGAPARLNHVMTVRGFAWSGDGAYVTRVDVSTDGGMTWHAARLGESLGKYAWREFTYAWKPEAVGRATVMARASDNRGAIQPKAAPWNPGGYLWNGIQSVQVEVTNA